MIYGLTGGIGAGKGAVSEILKEHGFKVMSADDISREVTKKESPLLNLLVKEFGNEILKEDGELDRRKLADMAFGDRDKTRRLNNLVQSAVLVRAIEHVNRISLNKREEIIFFEVPMLFEAGWDRLFEQVWLVTAPKETRIDRVIARDGLTENQILTRMNLQMSEEEKRRRADVILDNSGDMNQLRRNVEAAIAAM